MEKSSFIQDFKAFAMRGNVMDMAVGVIVGGAFGKIVSSLVADIIMPAVGLLIGGVDFRNLSLTLKDAVKRSDGTVVTEAVTRNNGNFLQATVDYELIAISIFVAIRLFGKLNRKKTGQLSEQKPATPHTPSREEELLTEIRDLLKGKRNGNSVKKQKAPDSTPPNSP